MITPDLDAPTATLASPLTLACGVTLSNRIVKSAMSEQLSTNDGDATPGLTRLYRRWAEGGLGMTITGNWMVDRRALGEPRNVVVEDDRDIAELVHWAAAAKSGGAPAIVQLNHPGRQALTTVSSQVVAPSAVRVKIPGAPFGTPRALTHDEILNLIERFAIAATVAVQAGFDGIQLHGAHGYLISQFLSPLANVRDDEWGGDAERRRRFVVELVRATRAAVGPSKVVAVKLNSADFQRGGFSEEESLDVIRVLGEEGVDFIEISGGTYERPAMVGARPRGESASTASREAYFLEFAARARQVTDVPLMLTGGMRSSRAMSEALREGIDIIGVARPVCLEPDLPGRLIADPSTVSKLQPIRTGVGKLDAPADLWWSSIQIHRLAAGKQPRRRLTGWETLGHVIVRDGISGLRRKRS